MKLPKRIRIGWRWYRVMRFSAVDSVTSSRFGECDTNQAVIRVTTSYGAAKTAHTFCHELLHGMWTERGLSKDNGEETVVSELSHALCCFARDNPAVVQAWLDTMKADR